MSSDDKSLLSASACAKIDHWLKKYPENQSQSAVLSALSIVQEENGGYLTESLVAAVADYLQIPKIAAYEVATFYSLLHLTPCGKHRISVCTNVSCKLRGAAQVLAHLQARLNISVGETTADRRFTLCAVECLAACANAPMMQIGKNYHENLTPSAIDRILEQLD